MDKFDLDAITKSLQSGKNTGSADKIASLMKGPQGQQLMNMFSGEKGEVMRRAAEAAMKGDTSAAKNIMNNVLSTKEGAAIAKQVMDIVKE